MLQKKSGRQYSGIVAIFATLLILAIFISGCIMSNDTRDGGAPQETQPPVIVEHPDAVTIALNDSDVQYYLRNGYTLEKIEPLCYEQSLSDRKIYKSCFTGIEFETPDVFLVVYVDMKKGKVNKTFAMNHRNPVVPVNVSPHN